MAKGQTSQDREGKRIEKGGKEVSRREERRKGVGEEGTVWKGWNVEETRCSPPDHYKG